jgi:hypothetical protein
MNRQGAKAPRKTILFNKKPMHMLSQAYRSLQVPADQTTFMFSSRLCAFAVDKALLF